MRKAELPRTVNENGFSPEKSSPGKGSRGKQTNARAKEQEGKTVVLIGDEAATWGIIGLRDTIRADAAQAIAALRSAGIGRVISYHSSKPRTLSGADWRPHRRRSFRPPIAPHRRRRA
jgi:hypothetical protein